MKSIREYLLAQARRLEDEKIDFRKQVNMSHVPALLKGVVSARFLLYIAIRIDVLEPVLYFIKVTQAVDMDAISFAQEVLRVKGKLEELQLDGNGAHFREMRQVLLTPGNKYDDWPGVKEFRGDPNLQIRYRGYARDAAGTFLSNFIKIFPPESMEWMDMYQLLSMSSFRLQVKQEAHLHKFGRDCFTKIKKFFCEDCHYTCTWPEDMDQDRCARAIFSMAEFKKVMHPTTCIELKYHLVCFGGILVYINSIFRSMVNLKGSSGVSAVEQILPPANHTPQQG